MVHRIRKTGMTTDLWLSRSGKWVQYKFAAKFASQDAAEKFAKSKGINESQYGIF